jgi:hypothetical protein
LRCKLEQVKGNFEVVGGQGPRRNLDFQIRDFGFQIKSDAGDASRARSNFNITNDYVVMRFVAEAAE